MSETAQDFDWGEPGDRLWEARDAGWGGEILLAYERGRQDAPPPLKLLPVVPGDPADELAHAMARELVIDGFSDTRALSAALKLLAGLQEAIDAGDPRAGAAQLRAARRQSDQWWVRYHRNTDYGRAAALRLADAGREDEDAPDPQENPDAPLA